MKGSLYDTATPTTSDSALGVQAAGPNTRRWLLSDLITLFLNNIPAAEGGSGFVSSGGVWTGDAYGSTRAASMTAMRVKVNTTFLSISAVTARVFTASKDTYVDVLDNGDGTGTLVYSEVANNAASPALAANSMRIAIIVTGAGSIAAVGSINQGQEDKVLPIASSIPYQVTDSLGNLICVRNPFNNLIGYRQSVADFNTTAVATDTDITGMSVPCIVPTGRKIRLRIYCGSLKSNAGGASTVALQVLESSTRIAKSVFNLPSSGYNEVVVAERVITPSAGLHTYKGAVSQGGSGTLTAQATSSPGSDTPGPLFFGVWLE